MAKFQSPLLGYNNNVRHKNRVFHIQTEDSGVKHPHIITHLFMDGGRILKSVKTSYAEHLGADGMSETVKQLMKAQHKAMFIALRDGQFDHLADPTVENAPRVIDMKAPPAPPSAPSSSPRVNEAPSNTVPAPPPSSALDVNLSPPIPSPRVHTPPVVRAAAATIPDDSPISAVPLTAREDLTLDFDALERSNIPPARRSPSVPDHELLPPTPANLVRRLDQAGSAEVGTGRYRTLKREEPASEPELRAATPSAPVANKPASNRPRKGTTPRPPKPKSERPAPATAPADAGQGRYAPARPAAIFGQARPQQSSIFGEDLISDKSLDEVILSYLAEDLGSDAKK
ncbi:MAG: hypothetical protein ABI183_00470 [Polyangiaceae bacterium]